MYPCGSLIRHLDSRLLPPKGTNWGYFSDQGMDKLFDSIRTEFDPAAQETLIRKVHEKDGNEALFLFVAHDVGPRAMAQKVRGFVQAQNWFQDLSPVSVGN